MEEIIQADISDEEREALKIVAALMDRLEATRRSEVMFESSDQYYVSCAELAARLRQLAS